ncbi:MAG: hypothetical protein HY958_04455 [Bacteroidia bacterium]|nr:hypothetical protein [Bacteroidia bacterium]
MKRYILLINNLFLVVFIAAIIFSSCTSDNDQWKKVTKDSVQTKPGHKRPPVYKIPSPIELYLFLKENNIRFDKNLLGNPDNVSKYETTKNKGLNFGIYASDLAYCTVFSRSQETFLYFKSSKTLADGLGLAEGFDDIISKRLNNNMNNTDSLYEITNDAYAAACQYLESEDKSDILSYILVGSWIESMHLSMNSVTKFKAENPVVVRIAEQQLILENLNASLDNIDKKDTDFSEMKTKMKNLQTIFDKLYENTDALITKKQFDEIFSKIKELRKEVIG